MDKQQRGGQNKGEEWKGKGRTVQKMDRQQREGLNMGEEFKGKIKVWKRREGKQREGEKGSQGKYYQEQGKDEGLKRMERKGKRKKMEGGVTK